jgi:hypothetical protein
MENMIKRHFDLRDNVLFEEKMEFTKEREDLLSVLADKLQDLTPHDNSVEITK